MSMSLIMSMSVFALAASISPGPVNLVCLSSGTKYSIRTGLVFVTGATLGFILLFLAIGLGLYSLLEVFPGFQQALKYAGIVFLLYMSLMLFNDKGQLSLESGQKSTSFMMGILMQWLNPKAWLASASGIGAYTQGDDMTQVVVFAAVYLPICWLSLGSWVGAGAFLRRYIENPRVLIRLNRSLALAIFISCLFLVFQ